MPSHVVRGVVVDTAGRTVDEAAVSFVDGPGSWPDIAAVTGPDGRFALTAPVPGRYRIGVRAPDRDPVEVTVDVPGDIDPAAPEDVAVTVTLAEGGPPG